MPLIAYVPKTFRPRSIYLIDLANEIIADYEAQGFDLTLRQLYYQMVARDEIPNTPHSYDNLGALINDARLAGLVDWDSITDRTRNIRANSHWSSPKDILKAAASSFRLDRWKNQRYRPEVWVEKDALIGVIATVCEPLDIPHFACRGYTSQSEMWAAAQRIRGHMEAGYIPQIFHLGDHDPSGIDMSRDIEDRLNKFINHDLEEADYCPSWFDGAIPFERLALNHDQIRRYSPPPNPAKMTDSRAGEYVKQYGESSWELDALPPTVIAGLINDAVDGIRDQARWDATEAQENAHKAALLDTARKWGRASGA